MTPMDLSGLVNSFKNIGGAVLAICVIIAILFAFFGQGRGKLLGIAGALAVGCIAYAVIGDPTTMLKQGGDVFKSAIWTPFINAVNGH